MKKYLIIFIIIFSFQNTNAQDTTYISLIIDGSKINLPSEFNLKIEYLDQTIPLTVHDGSYILTSKIEGPFSILLSYQKYKLKLKSIPSNMLKNRIEFVVENYQYLKPNKHLLFKKKKFLYYYQYTTNLSDDEIEKYIDNGFLLSYLRTKKKYKGKL